jgi:hypothetical protein
MSDEIQAKTPKFVRYVLYAEGYGMYLGSGWFSQSNYDKMKQQGPKPQTAVTVENAGCADQLVAVIQSLGEDFPPYQLREVLPSGPDGRATSQDCTDRLLPGW